MWRFYALSFIFALETHGFTDDTRLVLSLGPSKEPTLRPLPESPRFELPPSQVDAKATQTHSTHPSLRITGTIRDRADPQEAEGPVPKFAKLTEEASRKWQSVEARVQDPITNQQQLQTLRHPAYSHNSRRPERLSRESFSSAQEPSTRQPSMTASRNYRDIDLSLSLGLPKLIRKDHNDDSLSGPSHSYEQKNIAEAKGRDDFITTEAHQTLRFQQQARITVQLTEASDVYAWVGSISAMATSKIDQSLIELLEPSHRKIFGGGKYMKRGLLKSRLQGWDTARKQDEGRHKIFDLCVKVASINSQFLQLFSLPSAVAFEKEQVALQNWLINFIISKGILFAASTFDPRKDTVLKSGKSDQLEILMHNFLGFDAGVNPFLWIIGCKKGLPCYLTQLTSVITRVAVYMLATYYKSKNEYKWTGLFLEDNGFLKVLAAIKTAQLMDKEQALNSGSIFIFKKTDNLQILPWQEELDPTHKAQLGQVFSEYLSKDLEQYWTGNLLHYTGPESVS